LRLLIFLPAGPGQITANYAFNRQRLGLAHDHRAAGEHFSIVCQLFRKLIEVRGDKVIIDLIEAVEPEGGELI
jgi:hypothetical protein